MPTESSSFKIEKKNYFSLLKTRAIVAVIFLMIVMAYFFIIHPENNNQTIILENPLNQIIQKNTNAQGSVNKNKIMQEGVEEFNEEYIEYILYALGAQELYTSVVGFGTPKIILNIEGEIYNTEIISGVVHLSQNSINDPDFTLTLSKKEIVAGLMAPDIKKFLVESFQLGSVKAEMLASKPELISKGYWKLYENTKF
ncbi:MAG: hypothetical protein AABX16_02395 [Nanoarchaeota archaeon]